MIELLKLKLSANLGMLTMCDMVSSLSLPEKPFVDELHWTCFHLARFFESVKLVLQLWVIKWL